MCADIQEGPLTRTTQGSSCSCPLQHPNFPSLTRKLGGKLQSFSLRWVRQVCWHSSVCSCCFCCFCITAYTWHRGPRAFRAGCFFVTICFWHPHREKNSWSPQAFNSQIVKLRGLEVLLVSGAGQTALLQQLFPSDTQNSRALHCSCPHSAAAAR